MTLDEFKIKVKTWLKANGHDYSWLAKQLNGVSESTIRNWMARKDIPQAKRVEMAAVCDIDIEADPVGPLVKDGKEQPQKRHRRTKEEILADKAREAAEKAAKSSKEEVDDASKSPKPKLESEKPDSVTSKNELKQPQTTKPSNQSCCKSISKYTLQLDVDAIYVHRMEVYAAKHGKTGADLLEEFFKSFPKQ